MSSLRVTCNPLRSARDIPHHSLCLSPFTTSQWTASWIKTIGKNCTPSLCQLFEGNRLLSSSIGSIKRRLISGIIPGRSFHFLETGNSKLDVFAPEYSPLVEDLSGASSNLSEMASLLLEGSDIDVISLAGLSAKEFSSLQNLSQKKLCLCDVQQEDKSFSVNLKLLRNQNQDYVSVLSANTRSRVRRALGKFTNLKILVPNNKAEALTYLDDLEKLHQQRWVARRQPGAFASKIFKKQLITLLEDHFDSGFIQLMKIQSSEYCLGYLLNFVVDGTVFNYQSGINYQVPKDHPGLVVHASAIQYFLDAGYQRYDFMAGTSQYKESLSTESEKRFWVDVYRPLVRWKLLLQAKKYRRLIRNFCNNSTRVSNTN